MTVKVGRLDSWRSCAAPWMAWSEVAASDASGGGRTEANGGHARGEVPVIDGVLDEAIWQEATLVTDFVQTEPVEGQPATERTEVRILYDDRAIYIGVICFDSEPSRIITTDSRRDSGLGDMDSFQMILDTYHDQQNGFVFGTNAVGTQYDAQIRNEGQSGGGGGAPAAGPDLRRVGWRRQRQLGRRLGREGPDHGDGVDARSSSIPLRTLRYGPPPQLWGLNFTRNIQRKRETVYWSPVSRIYNLPACRLPANCAT